MAYRRRYARRRRRRRSRRPFRRRTRRRRYYGRRRRGRRAMTIPREIVPRLLYVTLPYVENYNYTLNVNTQNEHIYRANSIYDPNFILTGHQPLGADQWANLYDRYTVVRSKCTIITQAVDRHTELSGAYAACSNITCTIACVPESQYLDYIGLSDSTLQEQPMTQCRMGSAENTTNRPIRLTSHYNAATFWKRKVLSDRTQASNFDNNPTSQAYWCFRLIGHGVAGAQMQITQKIKITYVCAFRRPDVFPTS